MRRFVLILALLLASGCAGKARRAPTAEVPPPSPPPTVAEPAPTTPAPRPVSAPWDTAGSASARAARRNHVYPQGPNALGQKLVDSLPDPAAFAKGAESSDAGAASKPAEESKPSAPPANDRACWEVQVLVTTNRDRARQEVAHIERVLDLAAWMRDDGGIYRVRAGGCLTSDGAAQLADRLRQEGYPEAFRTMRLP
jgi:cell division septation protein DedD